MAEGSIQLFVPLFELTNASPKSANVSKKVGRGRDSILSPFEEKWEEYTGLPNVLTGDRRVSMDLRPVLTTADGALG